MPVPAPPRYGLPLASLLLLLSQSARAEVQIELAPECGSETRLRTEIEQMKAGAQVDVGVTSVSITRRGDGDYLLVLVSPTGRRELVDPDCGTLFRAAVVIAAASAAKPDAESAASPDLDPVPMPASESTVSSNPSPSPSVEAPETQAPSAPAAHEAQVPTPGPVVRTPRQAAAPKATTPLGLERFRIGAGAGLDVGLNPKPALLLELTGTLSFGRFAGGVAARYLPPTETLTQGTLGVGLEVFGGRVGGSYRLTSWLRLELGLSVYHLGARGLGATEPAYDALWLAAPEAEIAMIPARWRMFAIEGALQGRLGLTEPRFEIAPATVVHQVPRAGLGALFRVSWIGR